MSRSNKTPRIPISLSYRLENYETAIMKLVGDIKTGLNKNHPILGKIRVVQVSHGGITRQVSEPTVVDTAMEHYRTDVLVDVGIYRTTNVNEFVSVIYKMFEDFNTDAVKQLFNVVSKTTNAVGNVIDSRFTNIWDAQIEMLKTMEISFDQDGNHDLCLYVHPDTLKTLQSIDPTDEQKLKIDEILNTKREEFNAKKRSRRLS